MKYTGKFHDGYMIDGEYIVEDKARRFHEMVKKAPLIEISKQLKKDILSFDSEDIVVIKSDLDIHPGRQVILSAERYKDVLNRIFEVDLSPKDTATRRECGIILLPGESLHIDPWKVSINRPN